MEKLKGGGLAAAAAAAAAWLQQVLFDFAKGDDYVIFLSRKILSLSASESTIGKGLEWSIGRILTVLCLLIAQDKRSLKSRSFIYHFSRTYFVSYNSTEYHN